MAPETSMEVQAALRSDIALVFDECTPFHVTREYTARSTERTHRWLERCLRWHERHGPSGQTVYGIVQGGVEQDLRVESAETWSPRAAATGIAIGGSLGQDKPQMYEVVVVDDGGARSLRAATAPATCSGSVTSTTSSPASNSESTRSTARCRRDSRAMASRSCPSRTRAGASTSPRLVGGSRRSPSWRAVRARRVRMGSRGATFTTSRAPARLTGPRLLTLHNLSFIAAPDGRSPRRDRCRADSRRSPRYCAPAPHPACSTRPARALTGNRLDIYRLRFYTLMCRYFHYLGGIRWQLLDGSPHVSCNPCRAR